MTAVTRLILVSAAFLSASCAKPHPQRGEAPTVSFASRNDKGTSTGKPSGANLHKANECPVMIDGNWKTTDGQYKLQIGKDSAGNFTVVWIDEPEPSVINGKVFFSDTPLTSPKPRDPGYVYYRYVGHCAGGKLNYGFEKGPEPGKISLRQEFVLTGENATSAKLEVKITHYTDGAPAKQESGSYSLERQK